MATGVVKWFNNDKGYGFVTMDDEDESEVFVHHSAIDMQGFKKIKHGQRVEFSLYYGPKGLTASYLKQLCDDNGEVMMQGDAAGDAATPPLP
jgi:CspA family cold shock protein